MSVQMLKRVKIIIENMAWWTLSGPRIINRYLLPGMTLSTKESCNSYLTKEIHNWVIYFNSLLIDCITYKIFCD